MGPGTLRRFEGDEPVLLTTIFPAYGTLKLKARHASLHPIGTEKGRETDLNHRKGDYSPLIL
jgi:hypothetical protein